ncbi:MAG TPA: DUF2018 family protein [Epsilonproteobacteria bacterium]|nr:DUF2018 family protein [Campylobacterota bacterium]
MNIFNQEDDFLVGNPRDNYFEIAKTANANIVNMEIEKILQRLAVAEKMLEEKGLEAEYEKLLKYIKSTDLSDLENRTNSLFIELVGNIVTQCE